MLPITTAAQFYVTGDDPGRLKWYRMDTDNYSIIYPEGTDSLARVYGSKLEKFRIPVSRTAGYIYNKRLPVIMHAYNAQSNGSVAWAPERMDLFTIPSPYNPEPLSWSTLLSVHESRHIAQMQFGMTDALKPGNWIFGQMWNILVSILYPGMDMIEGDAVIIETALTKSGRGRTADFLNYYRVAFDQGDSRSWSQWRFGSQKNYTPDYYALGYLTYGGIRYLYDCPHYMDSLYHLAARKPYNLFAKRTNSKNITGGKIISDVFPEVRDTVNRLWREDAAVRAPFIPMEQITETPDIYTDYTRNVIIDNTLYSVKDGFRNTDILVRIDSCGKETRIADFSSQTGQIEAVKGKEGSLLMWSENIPDRRWSMKTDSRLRYMKISEDGSHSSKKSFKTKSELLYNPDIDKSGTRSAFIEYHIEGGSSLIVKENPGTDASRTHVIAAPDGLQLIETAWLGEEIYVSGLSDDGFGIYRGDLAFNTIETILEPQPVKIKWFRSLDDELYFTSDRTGVNELYHLNPSNGELRQKTVTRYGAEDFVYTEDRKWVFYSSQTMEGKMIFRTPTDSLIDRKVDFRDLHHYHIAEKMAQQEKVEDFTTTEVTFSEPRRYSKVGNMFKVHSWAPLYVSVDNIMNMSFDRVYRAASLGLSGIMQNSLSTGVGEFGYSAHKDPYNSSRWRHSGHFKFTYSGLYPVIETSIDINDRGARQYRAMKVTSGDKTRIGVSSNEVSSPYVEADITMYIPWNFSSGGWYRGVIPQFSYNISNDFFNTGMAILEEYTSTEDDGIDYPSPSFASYKEGENHIMQRMTASVRGYTMMGTTNSNVFPKWGIGLEAGASSCLEEYAFFSPMGYLYSYGYIPGIFPYQGVKLTFMHQHKLRTESYFGQAIVNIAPRGFNGNSALLSNLSIYNDSLTKISADYAIPISIGDISIFKGLFYIKRLVITPHFDYTFIKDGGLFSTGADLAIDLNSILYIGWPCSFGITYSYNGGKSFAPLNKNFGLQLGHHHVGPFFNVTF